MPYKCLMAIGFLYLFLFFCLGQIRNDFIKVFVGKSSPQLAFQSLTEDFEAGDESGESQDDMPIDGKASKDFLFHSILSPSNIALLAIEKKYVSPKGRSLTFVFFEITVPPPEHTRCFLG